MANVLVQESSLQAIATEIRQQNTTSSDRYITIVKDNAGRTNLKTLVFGITDLADENE